MQFYPYGSALAAAALVGLCFFAWQVKRQGLKSETVGLLAVLAIPFGVLGGRAVYCLCRFTWFMEQGMGWFFRLTEGGFMMYGALLGVLLAGFLVSKITHQSAASILDAVAAPGLVTYSLGRMADLLCGQGYGWPIEDWFSVEAFDPEEYTGMSVFHLEDVSFFEGLPFSVEDGYYGNFRWAVSLWIGVLGLVLVVILLRARFKREGSRSIFCITLLACLTVLLESMRQDDLMRWGVVRAGQIFSAVLLALLLVVCQVRMQPRPGAKTICLEWVSLLGGMGLVMVAEFMLEKKIVFLDFVPMDGCYVLMILACIWMGITVHAALKRQDAA